MSSPAVHPPLYQNIGKPAKDVLYGSQQEGLFQFDKKFSVSTITADGVNLLFQTSATRGPQALSHNFVATYAPTKK